MNYIPTHKIFEVVFKCLDVSAKEYNTERKNLKSLECRSIMVIMLKRHTMKSNHQIGELMGLDAVNVLNVLNRESCYVNGGFVETKIREIEININRLSIKYHVNTNTKINLKQKSHEVSHS